MFVQKEENPNKQRTHFPRDVIRFQSDLLPTWALGELLGVTKLIVLQDCHSGPVQGFYMQEWKWKHRKKLSAKACSWVKSPGVAWRTWRTWRPALIVCFQLSSSFVLQAFFPHAVVSRAAGRDEGAGLLSQKGARTIEIQCERGCACLESARGQAATHAAQKARSHARFVEDWRWITECVIG